MVFLCSHFNHYLGALTGCTNLISVWILACPASGGHSPGHPQGHFGLKQSHRPWRGGCVEEHHSISPTEADHTRMVSRIHDRLHGTFSVLLRRCGMIAIMGVVRIISSTRRPDVKF